MTSEKGCRKEKNQNIQVFVRLRPLNQRERDIKSLGVVEVLHNREVVVRQSSQTTHTKKFTFDRAFSPNAKQVEVYQEVVSPLIEEVLAGYNCTVFAYGQTGTGKTHTMVGEHTSEDTNWQNDPLAGIIPRALSQLFDELRISNTEYTVRVSYLELYNEELFDLLSSSEDNSKLRIYEDVTRKGANIVNGLEEITVYNKNEVYKIMAQGQERKRVASTLMNAQSSRSHTVFTIVVHMKENSPEGEELVKIGKLNLVDLAGSENISKAGSDNPGKKERARECVNINQSLLTLGRVITALVERHPHVPYRESKLTRILQESLGGRTKTSIIATISPGHKDLEETMSTLEYANRAKNIQNKPEVNQKMTKKAILKEYAEEIDRLKRDLQAAREKSGVYLANETFAELTLQQEEQRKEIQRLLLKKRAMEEEKEKMENVFSDLSKTLEMRISELNATKNKLDNTKTQLANTNNMLRSTKMQYEEQVHLVEKHQATESTLSSQAKQLLATADTATTHVHCLHDSVDRRRNVEYTNLEVTSSYREQSSHQRALLQATTKEFTDMLIQELAQLHSGLESVTTSSAETIQNNKAALEQLALNITQTMEEIKSLTASSHASLSTATEAQHSSIRGSVEAHHGSVGAALASLLQSVAGSVLAAEGRNLPESVAGFVDQWYTSAVNRVESLFHSQRSFTARLADTESRRRDIYHAHHDKRAAHIHEQARKIQDSLQEIELEKAEIQARAERQLSSLEEEKKETELRLEAWVEEERRVFEERLQARVKAETDVLQARLSKKASEIEQERAEFEGRLARHLQSQHELLDACNMHLQMASVHLDEAKEQQEECKATVNSYGKEFDDDETAIRVDMEAFSVNVVEVVRHMYGDLLATLHRAQEQIQKDTKAVEEADKAAGDKLLADTKCAHSELLTQHQDNIQAMLQYIEANNTSTISSLSSLSTSADSLLASANHHTAAHASRVQDVTSRSTHFEEHIRRAVEQHGNLEESCLKEEYRVYCPTGATPQRTEYRYPRALAATSPHERLLARFRDRARRTSQGDDDCIVIDDPESRATSDGESSVSEDSAVFAAPSPPAPRNDAKLNGIMKCTSESNIYDIRRSDEQLPGKENADRSLTNGAGKRPSKLRAPASHKKPLYERNANN